MSHPLFVLAFAGPLLAPAVFVSEPAIATGVRDGKAPLARVTAELKHKDTDKINIITAGEEQKSSFGQCAKAADVALCRILVGAVNAAAIIGSSIGQ